MLPDTGDVVQLTQVEEALVCGTDDGRPQHVGLAHGGGRDLGDHHVHEQLFDVQHPGGQQLLGQLLVVLQVPDGQDADDQRHQPVEGRVERLERHAWPVDPETSGWRARSPRRRKHSEQVRADVQRPVEFHGARSSRPAVVS